MNAHRASTLSRLVDIESAREHVLATALTESPVGPVGLELEFHVVDLDRPDRRISWERLTALIADVPALPNGSPITSEPGGQLELSVLPMPDVSTAIAALQADEKVLRKSVEASGYGLAPIGADPARRLVRIAPTDRYVAMEQHFDAMGCGTFGRQMMASTAALQVNLDSGPSGHWAERIAHVHRVGPVLSAISACSPMIAGDASGWASMREQAWRGIDHARMSALAAHIDEPAEAWAEYALAAPVMLVRDPDGAGTTAVTQRIPFEQWAGDPYLLGRAPTLDDLDYHLTTLFPPMRMRGYLELRFLDAVPDAWWPALAAVVVTLIDDGDAKVLAAQACEQTENAWARAARYGLADETLRTAARRCLEIAATHCPTEFRPAVEAYGELVRSQRTPGDELREAIAARGPLDALSEAAHA